MSKRIDTYTKVNDAASASLLGVTSGNETRLYNVTTSATDTTAGRVMKVGDFGIGTNSNIHLLTANDSGLALVNGIYRTTTDTTGTFPTIQKTGVFVVQARLSSRVTQWFYPFSGASAWFRDSDMGVFSAWRELYHSGNYPSDTAWTSTTPINSWTGTIRYIKRAGTVTVMWDVNGSAKSANTFFTIDAAWRPGVELKQASTDGHVVIGTGGGFVSTSTGATIGMATYPVIT